MGMKVASPRDAAIPEKTSNETRDYQPINREDVLLQLDTRDLGKTTFKEGSMQWFTSVLKSLEQSFDGSITQGL